jgi:hypothetical protein
MEAEKIVALALPKWAGPEDFKELLPPVLRNSRVLVKVRTTTSVPLEPTIVMA